MEITSPTFKPNSRIPDEYSCNGENTNPPLVFRGIPPETQSLALIVEDPDAPMGTWDHWTIYNIDPTITEIAPDSVPENGIVLLNSSGKAEYQGPCPPPGQTHRYFFKLYALDTMLNTSLITDKPSLIEQFKGHQLATAELVGLYSR